MEAVDVSAVDPEMAGAELVRGAAGDGCGGAFRVWGGEAERREFLRAGHLFMVAWTGCDARGMGDRAGLRVLEQVERWLPEIIPGAGGAIVGVLCFVTPPFWTPDEPHQAARAISLGHGEWRARMGAREYGAGDR